ncbi:MAG: MBL fold metallo-hydrolase [Caldithrix sp. RBG_13_44_9]|nr:MAG: MBL fold metallo-hydrolase [Caldithrix sp. RBG_13_44_9]
MQIGKYEVQMIDAGRYKLDGGAMFGVVPRTLWQKENPPDEKNRILMSLNTLLLVSAGRVILIDSGVGNKFSDKFKEIYDIDYSHTSLLKSLAEKNIQPEDVTDVIVTHLHFDHVGGATHLDSDGQIQLQFPNANYYVQKKQLEWAQKGFPKDRASYLTENIEPLYKSRKLKILEGPQKLLEGVELILSEGHTVAQQMVKISGQNEKLIYLADLIPMTAHLNLPWVMAYDLHPVQTIQEKEEILEKATKEEWLLFFEHDPRIYCAQVYKSEKGYQLKQDIKL